MTEVEGLAKLQDEIYKYMPTEIICNDAFVMSGYDIEDLKGRLGMAVYIGTLGILMMMDAARCLMNHFKVNTLAGLGWKISHPA